MKKLSKILFLVGIVSLEAWCEPTKPIIKNGVPLVSGSMMPAAPAMQMGLDEALASFNYGVESHTAAVDNMANLPLRVSAAAQSNRNDAQKTMAYLDANPSKMRSFISFEDLVTFPVGFKQKLSDNSEVTVGVFSVDFDPTGASVTFFIRLRTKIDDAQPGASNERDLLLGVSGVRFTKNGGMSGDIKAGLLGDYPLPGKKWSVILKGGGDNIASPDLGKTYLLFTCNAFKEVKVTADIVFPRSVVVPFNETSRKPESSGRFTLTSSAIISSGLRDLVLNFSGNKSFAMANYTKYGFKISNAVIDMSDLRGDASVSFPANYQHPDMGDIATWRGVALQNITMLFPKEFEKESGSDLSITGMIIDKTGFTGKVSYTDGTGIVFGAKKWQFSIKTFILELQQNKFVSGGFGGDFYTPINGSPSEAGSKAFVYKSLLLANGDADFTITTDAADVPINCWKAKGFITAGSRISMSIKNDQFYPSCDLSGILTIGANKINSDAATEGHEEDATVSFKELSFTNLVITTDPVVNFSIGDFRYVNSANTKVSKYPVTITRFEKEDSPANEFWIGLGFKVSLKDDDFVGTTDLTIRSKYNSSTGKFVLGTDSGKKKISLNSIYIQGSTSVFSIVGFVEIFENKQIGTIQAKGFQGVLDIALYKPFKVGINAEAIFGRNINPADDYKFGYFSVYVGAPKKLVSDPGVKPVFAPADPQAGELGFKIPTGLGDLAINGLGLGIYFNMRPTINMADPGEVSYLPDNTIPFGFKVMLGIQNAAYTPTPPTFNGNVALDFSMSGSGINSIGIFGKATIASNSPTKKLSIGQLIDGKSAAELQNAAGVDHSQTGLIAKAASIQDVKETENGQSKVSGVAISIGILFDIPKRIAHAEAIVKVNQNGIVGTGPDFRAGRMVLHFENNNNYLHLGNTIDRVGLRFNDDFEFNAYLMAGKGLTPFPKPPIEVLNFFPSLASDLKFSNPDFSAINTASGDVKGFAMGAMVRAKIDLDGWLGYIKGYGVGGFDLMIAKGLCDPNKWMGKVQIYGVADISAGLLGAPIFDGAVGFFLYGQGMDPFGARGDVCVAYGRRNKKLCLGFKVGSTNCN